MLYANVRQTEDGKQVILKTSDSGVAGSPISVISMLIVDKIEKEKQGEHFNFEMVLQSIVIESISLKNNNFYTLVGKKISSNTKEIIKFREDVEGFRAESSFFELLKSEEGDFLKSSIVGKFGEGEGSKVFNKLSTDFSDLLDMFLNIENKVFGIDFNELNELDLFGRFKYFLENTAEVQEMEDPREKVYISLMILTDLIRKEIKPSGELLAKVHEEMGGEEQPFNELALTKVLVQEIKRIDEETFNKFKEFFANMLNGIQEGDKRICDCQNCSKLLQYIREEIFQ